MSRTAENLPSRMKFNAGFLQHLQPVNNSKTHFSGEVTGSVLKL